MQPSAPTIADWNTNRWVQRHTIACVVGMLANVSKVCHPRSTLPLETGYLVQVMGMLSHRMHHVHRAVIIWKVIFWRQLHFFEGNHPSIEQSWITFTCF